MGKNPEPNFDVTETSGYTVENKISQRVANSYGGSQTKLPKGHLARRDTPITVKRTDGK